MFDQRMTTTELAEDCVRIIDHVEMGCLVADWSTGQRARPETVEELRRELSGIAEIPERFTGLVFVQDDAETLVIHLPERQALEQAVSELSDPECESCYPFPQFYADFYRPSYSPVMSPLDILMARIGDRTLAQCR